MKWQFVLLLIVVLCVPSVAQNNNSDLEKSFPKISLAVSNGSNNFTSWIGLMAEVSPIKNIAALGGIGYGPWGVKSSVGLRYYQKYAKGIYYTLSFSSCNGKKNDTLSLETYNSNTIKTQDVILDLNKVRTLNLSIGYSWQLSKSLRFTLDLGYSLPLNVNAYEIKTKDIVLTESSKQSIDYMAPGGFIFGVAFSIGL
jgi:hypothetical protein